MLTASQFTLILYILNQCVNIKSIFILQKIPSIEECPNNGPKTSEVEILWIKQLLNNEMSTFIPKGPTEEDSCTRHGELYKAHVQNLTLWAIQMLDASGGPDGLLSGNSYNFGNFDQCVSVDVPQYGIKGKFMMASIEFAPNKNIYPQFRQNISNVFYTKPPESSVWETLKPSNDPRINQLNVINWALCVPSSCNDDFIKTSLVQSLRNLSVKGIETNITILEDYSYSRDDNKHDSSLGYNVFIFFTAFMIVAVLLASLYDIFEEKESSVETWCSNFSIKSNINKLLKSQSDEFSSISGIKVLSMFIIIYGHRMICSVFSPMFNQLENELLIGDFLHTYIQNGHLVVNTFMVITGFLTYYKVLKDIDKKKGYNVLRYVYHRWIRLTPAYLYVILFIIFAFPRLEMGPLRKHGLQSCPESWWTHILYINNYYLPDKQCLIPSWYLAVDMQLYIVTSISGFILFKSRKLGMIILYIATVICALIPGIMVVVRGYEGVFLLFNRNWKHIYKLPMYIESYAQTHCRATPYLIGMIAGYIYYKIKSKPIKMSQKTMWIISITVGIIFNLTWTAPWFFYLPGRSYNMNEHVLYAIIHRIIWSVTICWVIICDSTSDFAPFRNTLGLKIWQILNGLNYTALLVHTPLQLYSIGTFRTPLYYTTIGSLWMSAGDIAISYILAFLLYIFVEAPLSGLQDCKIKWIEPYLPWTTPKDKKEQNVK